MDRSGSDVGPAEPVASAAGLSARPHWSTVLRALREARGVTQDGWGVRLGVSRKTVHRWERGERVPDTGAESALLRYCWDEGLFRRHVRGPLAGLDLSAEVLQALLAEARRRVRDGKRTAVPPGEPPATTPSPAAPAAPANLPVQLTSFVGRRAELATVRELQAGTRLLTLTGAGGSGKTRLALALANDVRGAYRHGVWFVDLSVLTESVFVATAVATALDIHVTGGRPVADALLDALRARHLLLILDNCEHLLPACAEVAESLLRACPELALVATSRASLGVAGETVWRVPPMSVPGVDGAEPARAATSNAASAAPGTPGRGQPARSTDAVQLFVERARLRRPAWAPSADEAAVIAQICRQLDGLPLAIELAAARIDVLSIAQIGERLDDRFRLLTRGERAPTPRQQTLRAAMDWSYDLLGEAERATLRGVSVFAGGFTLEAAEAVCGAASSGQGAADDSTTPCPLPATPADVLDRIATLVDTSLVVVERHDEAVRYRLLETVRRYATEKLAEGVEAGARRGRHRAWYLALVATAERELYGPGEAEAVARLEREHDNLRAALAWSVEGGGGVDELLRAAPALARFWHLRGHADEGRRWLRRLTAAAGGGETVAHARAVAAAGFLAYVEGEFGAAAVLFEESLRRSRTLGDEEGMAQVEVQLAWCAIRGGEYAVARAYADASLARGIALGLTPTIAASRHILAQIAVRRGEYDRARIFLEPALAIERARGNLHGIASALDTLATIVGELGDGEGQAAARAEALAIYRRLGHTSGIAMILGDDGMATWLRREYDRASALLEESLTLYRQLGERANVARVLGYQSVVALFGQDYERAEALNRECMTLYSEAGDRWAIGRYLPVMAGVWVGRRRPERAATVLGGAATLRERLQAPLPVAFRAAHDQAVAAVRGVLGERAFAAAWAEGAAMSVDDLLDYAFAAYA